MTHRKKHYTITLNVEAKINVVRAKPRESRLAVPIDIDLVLTTLGIPTSGFTLVERSKWGVVEADNGPDQIIDLTKLPKKGRVKINFSLIAESDLHFSADARHAFGIQREDQGCPTRHGNDFKDQFIRRGVSPNQRQVTLHDMNTDGGRYHFALFVYRGTNPDPVAVCDPRIINK